MMRNVYEENWKFRTILRKIWMQFFYSATIIPYSVQVTASHSVRAPATPRSQRTSHSQIYLVNLTGGASRQSAFANILVTFPRVTTTSLFQEQTLSIQAGLTQTVPCGWINRNNNFRNKDEAHLCRRCRKMPSLKRSPRKFVPRRLHNFLLVVSFLFLKSPCVLGEFQNSSDIIAPSASSSSSSSSEELSNLTALTPEDQIVFDYDDDFPPEFGRFDLAFDTSLEGFRLPENILPLHYNLWTRPIPGYLKDVAEDDKWTAPARVKILVKCAKNTSQITLHASNLVINSNFTKVTNLNTSSPVAVINQTYSPLFHFYIIDLNETLTEGHLYEIYLEFTAYVYRSRKDGIYFTQFSDPADRSKTKTLISTLFAPTQARRAFPCFDEPQLKATFSIHVGRMSNVSSLSNMNLLSSKPIDGLDGWFWDEYATTVPMSTYLLAFVISNFEKNIVPYGNSSSQTNIGIQTWADEHHVRNAGASYATEVTEQILPFFESYLGVNYSLPKLDSVAMPKISYGGMESWGLIIYKESSLLYFANHSSEEERSKTTGLISHELAHQWFGNLVTFGWWSDIWLSEGISTYLQYVGVGEMYPEFDSWSRFVTDVFHSALYLDSRASTSHALHRPILNNDIILSVFDGIAYNKGASVLRMMEYAFSQPVFQAGLQSYVNKNAYKAVHQDRLFEALQGEVEKIGALPPNGTVKEIMDTWTLQPGYPLVSVSLQDDNTTIWIEQTRYDPDHLGLNGSWWVPITLQVEGNPNFEDTFPDLWLAPNDVYATVNISRDIGEWVIVNAASTGFYRVLYDVNLTEAIQRQLYLDHTAFPPSARCRIIDDYFTTASKQYIPIETALNMVSYVGRETDLAVWKTVFAHMKRIAEILGKDDAHIKTWINMRLGSALALIEEDISADEQENIPGMVTLRHNYLVSWACHFKVPKCLELATKLVTKWKENPEENSVPPGLRSTVYCAVASEGSAELFDFLTKKYKEEKNEMEKLLLLEGLSCARDMNMIQRELSEMSSFMLSNSTGAHEMEETKLKTFMKGAIAHSFNGRNMSWSFVKETFGKAVDMNSLDKTSVVGDIVSVLGDHWKTLEEKKELEAFAEMVGHKMNSNETNASLIVRSTMASSFQTTLDKIDTNIEWAENFQSRVQGWFELENYYFPEGFLTK